MQDPWVISGTLRDNILCGSVFDAERYAAVLDACELRPDLDAMGADRDLTLVGEQGVMLSGGILTTRIR
jgi:ABC-type multidrug transport system fused ATPase/permease subunit